MADPEPTPAVAQANPLQEAMAEARAEMEQRSAPEALPETGTGGVAETPPEPQQPSDEIDWSNPEAREAFLKEKFISVEEHERRKKDQLRNLQGELELAKQHREQQEREALLAELDELKESDPRGYTERIERDPKALAAITERANQIDPSLWQRASVSVATGLAQRLFKIRPELEEIAAEGGERWAAVVNDETGGPFGYIQRAALEEGKAQGVAEFKKSKEYKDAIAEAERRGAHGAIGDFTVESPSSDDAHPLGATRPKFDNDLQEAAWEASQALGRRPVNLTGIGTRRR